MTVRGRTTSVTATALTPTATPVLSGRGPGTMASASLTTPFPPLQTLKTYVCGSTCASAVVAHAEIHIREAYYCTTPSFSFPYALVFNPMLLRHHHHHHHYHILFAMNVKNN